MKKKKYATVGVSGRSEAFTAPILNEYADVCQHGLSWGVKSDAFLKIFITCFFVLPEKFLYFPKTDSIISEQPRNTPSSSSHSSFI